jgi:hypothetical protein
MLPKHGEVKSVTVLETNIQEGFVLLEFYNELRLWLETLAPSHDGMISEYYAVAPNLTEKPVVEGMVGPERVRFRVTTSFEYPAFLEVPSSASQMRLEWQEIVHKFTDGLSLLGNYSTDQVPVVYIPGLLPEHDFAAACREIDSIPTLITQSVHIDYSSVPWVDGEVSHDLRIAKVIVPSASVSNARQILGDTTLAIRGTCFTVIPVEELNGPFFVNNLRGHIYDQHHRMVIRCSGLPAWADLEAVYVSSEICGEPLPAESMHYTISDWLKCMSNDPTGSEPLNLISQILKDPANNDLIFIHAPAVAEAVWNLRGQMTDVFSRAFPGHTLTWTRHPELPPPSPALGIAPPPPPALPIPPLHGFLENQPVDGMDDDSVDQEQSLFSAETQLKSPDPDPSLSVAPNPTAGEDQIQLAEGVEVSSGQDADHPSPSTSPEAHTNAEVIAEMKELRSTVAALSNHVKDLSIKYDTTTASLTSIGDGIMELKTPSSSSPDNISGITGLTSLTTHMKAQITQTVNEALIAAYSPGGVVADRCKDDTDNSMTEFAGTMGDALMSMLLPEINATIVTSLRDGCTALLKMLRSPEIMQAGEVAAIVKRELSPQMSAITSGLARMAAAVEFSIGSPQGAVLGDSATQSTPTYEMLKELRYAMRLQGNRLSQGMDFFHKIAFNVLETLERERRIELEHEQTIRLYLKRLRQIRHLMNAIISEDAAPKEDTSEFQQQMLKYIDLVHQAQVEFEAYMASQQEEELPVFGPEPAPPGYSSDRQQSPPSPSNTFATVHPVGTFGNPHAEKGVDETFSQAMSHLGTTSRPPTRSESPAYLKDPPEEIPFEAECTVVPASASAPVADIVTLIGNGVVAIAQPLQDEKDETELEDEIEMAKALSISELELDDRKPAAKELPPTLAKASDDSLPKPPPESAPDSENDSQGVSVLLHAQTEVSNLTAPQEGPPDDASEATTVVSSNTETPSTPYRLRPRARPSSSP